MRYRGFLAIVAVSLATSLWAAAPDNPEALRIAKRCDTALKGKTQIGKASMTVRRPEWERTLAMDFWYVAPNKTFIRITAPAKDTGAGTLRLDANMWMYLPTVERVIKIPPSLMLQAWMGSDFSNDDLVKESSIVTDYTHEIAGETVEAREPCYRLIATPKPDAAVVWGKLIFLIRKSDYLPRREEFYDERGTLQKVLTFEDIRRTNDRNYPMRWRMVSKAKPGHETVLTYTSIEFDKSIPSSVFTRRNLERRF